MTSRVSTGAIQLSGRRGSPEFHAFGGNRAHDAILDGRTKAPPANWQLDSQYRRSTEFRISNAES